MTQQRHRRTLADLTPGVPPIVLGSDVDARLTDIAARLRTEYQLTAEREEYDRQFLAEAPRGKLTMLHVDDFSVISHIQGVAGLAGYPSRAFTRAHEGDVVAATFPVIDGYDGYLAERLKLGRPYYLQIAPSDGVPPYAVFTALLEDTASQQQLIKTIRASDEFVIHPYMGTHDAWRVARLLAKKSGRTVKLIAPLPTVASLANNKSAFLGLVREVLGDDASIKSAAVESLPELCVTVKKFASIATIIALKLSDSASGMGTSLFHSDELGRLDDDKLWTTLAAWAQEKEWIPGTSPAVEVERWEEEVLASPSIQLWLPPLRASLPLVEGIFDQQFIDDREEKVFEGSVPSQLPQFIQDQLSGFGAQLGRVLQLLGYVGRCSFDTVLVGGSVEAGALKFVECNGRWGGTSLPMTYANRLFGDYRRQPYAAADFMHEKLRGVSLRQLVETLDDILLDRQHGRGWAVVYNVGPLSSDGKLDVLTIGATGAEAAARQVEFRKLVEKRF
jgi:hypothetical protein